MSSPMFDIPEHFLIPVNADGNGPETDISKISAWLCWCGTRLPERCP